MTTTSISGVDLDGQQRASISASYSFAPNYYWGSASNHELARPNPFYEAEVYLPQGIRSVLIQADQVLSDLGGVNLTWYFSWAQGPGVAFGLPGSAVSFELVINGSPYAFTATPVARVADGKTYYDLLVQAPAAVPSAVMQQMLQQLQLLYNRSTPIPAHDETMNLSVQISSDGIHYVGANAGQAGTVHVEFNDNRPGLVAAYHQGDRIAVMLENGGQISGELANTVDDPNWAFGGPDLSRFTVTVNGTVVGLKQVVMNDNLVLVLNNAIPANAQVQVSYQDTAGDQVLGVAQTWHGNDAQSGSVSSRALSGVRAESLNDLGLGMSLNGLRLARNFLPDAEGLGVRDDTPGQVIAVTQDSFSLQFVPTFFAPNPAYNASASAGFASYRYVNEAATLVLKKVPGVLYAMGDSYTVHEVATRAASLEALSLTTSVAVSDQLTGAADELYDVGRTSAIDGGWVPFPVLVLGTAWSDNLLIGSALADTIWGGLGNETLQGGAGSDSLAGAGGNDWLDGGAGTDTAQYRGLRSNYSLQTNAQGQSLITDLRSGSPDGTDTLISTEWLQFSDQRLANTAGSGLSLDLNGSGRAGTPYFWMGPYNYRGTAANPELAQIWPFNSAELTSAAGLRSFRIQPDLTLADLNGAKLDWRLNVMSTSAPNLLAFGAPGSPVSFQSMVDGQTYALTAKAEARIVNGVTYHDLVVTSADVLSSSVMQKVLAQVQLQYNRTNPIPSHEAKLQLAVQISADATLYAGAGPDHAGFVTLELQGEQPTVNIAFHQADRIVLGFRSATHVDGGLADAQQTWWAFGLPDLALLTVTVNGVAANIKRVHMEGALVLTMETAIPADAQVQVSYRDPLGDQISGVAQTWRGNDAQSGSVASTGIATGYKVQSLAGSALGLNVNGLQLDFEHYLDTSTNLGDGTPGKVVALTADTFTLQYFSTEFAPNPMYDASATSGYRSFRYANEGVTLELKKAPGTSYALGNTYSLPDLVNLANTINTLSLTTSLLASQQTFGASAAVFDVSRITALDGSARPLSSFALDVAWSDNLMVGGPQADTLNGSLGHETLQGGAGDDTLAGGAGNDWLEGGWGSDTAIYPGLRSDYRWQTTMQGQTLITDLRQGAPDGIDTLVDMELLKFSDQQVQLRSVGVDLNGRDWGPQTGYSTGPHHYWGSSTDYSLAKPNPFYQAGVYLPEGIRAMRIQPDQMPSELGGVKLTWYMTWGANPQLEFGVPGSPVNFQFASGTSSYALTTSSVARVAGGKTYYDLLVQSATALPSAVMQQLLQQIQLQYNRSAPIPAHDEAINLSVLISSDGVSYVGANAMQAGTAHVEFSDNPSTLVGAFHQGDRISLLLKNASSISGDLANAVDDADWRFGVPDLSRFTVMVNGAAVGIKKVFMKNDLVLVLENTIPEGAAVQVSYTDSAGDQVMGVAQTWYGNDMASGSVSSLRVSSGLKVETFAALGQGLRVVGIQFARDFLPDGDSLGVHNDTPGQVIAVGQDSFTLQYVPTFFASNPAYDPTASSGFASYRYVNEAATVVLKKMPGVQYVVGDSYALDRLELEASQLQARNFTTSAAVSNQPTGVHARLYDLATNTAIDGSWMSFPKLVIDQAWSDNMVLGTALADYIKGGLGHDTLQGGAGADTLAGGLGDDVYLGFDAEDTVVEEANGGTDTLVTELTQVDLIDHPFVENLTYQGKSSAVVKDLREWLTADEIARFGGQYVTGLVGSELNNRITGGTGNDWLEGGGGSDALYGGAGNDVLQGFYEYDDDEARADASFMALLKAQAPFTDWLYGGPGNDIYPLDSWSYSKTTIVELPGEGTDMTMGGDGFVMPDNVEINVNDSNKTVNGVPVFVTVTGNSGGNLMSTSLMEEGWASKERFYGMAGNDTLVANGGNDWLDGGAGTDTSSYRGQRIDYSWTTNAQGQSVITDLRTGSPDGVDTLVSVEWLQFADQRVMLAPAAEADLHGMVYHWKSHQLMSDVKLLLAQQPATTSQPALFELRNLTATEQGDVVAEVWVNSPQAVGSIDLNLRFDAAVKASFVKATNTLTDWSYFTEPDATGGLRLGAIGAATDDVGLRGSVQLGKVIFDLPMGTTSATIDMAGGLAGETQTLAPYSVDVGFLQSSTGLDGAYGFEALQPASYRLSANKSVATDSVTGINPINAADALAALKIAVGRNPNSNGAAVSPYQFMAADINGDGKVTSADALSILKLAVKRVDAPAREWLMVDETADFWNEATKAFTTTRLSVQYDKVVDLSSPERETVNLVGVLKGDVNGSWTGPTGSQSLDTLMPNYLKDLATSLGVPASQWAVI